jgi:phospholipid/cholesterol/gamma-HCH transport system substrate-binding protein
MLASFPFPKEAANIVRGDYANALFHMDIDLNKVIKSPGEVLPNVINLCSSLPLAPACDALSPVLKASVCAVAPQDVIDLLCPPGSAASQKNPIPLPDLGLGNKSGGSGSSSSGSSGGGGLGGLLGLGGGG